MAAMAARFCASVTMNFNTLAGAFTKLSSMPWVLQQVGRILAASIPPPSVEMDIKVCLLNLQKRISTNDSKC